MAQRYHPYKAPSGRVAVVANHKTFQRELMRGKDYERVMMDYGDEVLKNARKKAIAYYSSRRATKKTKRGGVAAATKREMWENAEEVRTTRKLSDRHAFTFGLKGKQDGRRYTRKGVPVVFSRDFEMYKSEQKHGFIKKQLKKRNKM